MKHYFYSLQVSKLSKTNQNIFLPNHPYGGKSSNENLTLRMQTVLEKCCAEEKRKLGASNKNFAKKNNFLEQCKLEVRGRYIVCRQINII